MFYSTVHAQLDKHLFQEMWRERKPPRLGNISFRLRENEGVRRFQGTTGNIFYASNPFNGLPTLAPSPHLKEWRIDESVFLSSANVRRSKSWFGGRLSTMTAKLVAANTVAFLLQVISPSITRWGAKLSEPILRGEQLHRLLTPIFLHGGLSHLAINSASLLNLGPQVESIMGKKRFLATYLVSGAVGNLFSSFFSPNPSVGASGAIFGLVGAYYTFLRVNEPLFGTAGERGMRALQQTFVTNLAYGFLSPSIDNWGHFGGALGGAAAAYAFGPRLFVTTSAFSGRRILVDKPILRVPKHLESLPETLLVQLQRLKRKLQVDRFTAGLSSRRRQRKNGFGRRR